MPTIIKIGGVDVDQEDPCALYQALYAAKLKLLAGDRLEEIEIQSPATKRRLRVAESNMAAIDAELESLARACDAASGRRRRFAKSARFVR